MGPIDAQDRLVVRLLGDPEVSRGSTLVTAFESRRLQALLAFLIVGRAWAIARQRLAFEFWPDSTDGQARTNLRQALHHLRHALGNAEQFVRDDGHCVQWRADGPATIDVVRFERAGSRVGVGRRGGAGAGGRRVPGELLAGWYDDWLIPERERLRALAADVLRALVGAARRRADGPAPLGWASGWFGSTPSTRAATGSSSTSTSTPAIGPAACAAITSAPACCIGSSASRRTPTPSPATPR